MARSRRPKLTGATLRPPGGCRRRCDTSRPPLQRGRPLLLEVYGGPKLPPNLPSIARKGGTYAMDTHEEEFALMRLAFLRAALEEAEAVGDGPTSWVSLERVAERL